MEASVAANGQAAQAAQGDGGQAADGQQQGPDIGALAGQLEQLQGGQEELRQFLLSNPWQQQEAAEPETPSEPEALDLSFLDPDDPGWDPQQVAQRLSGLIDQAAEQKMQPLQERLNSIESTNAEARREAEAERLANEFPELQQRDVAEQVVGAAQQIAEAYGQPELANEPWFWRMTYMAGRAAESAQQEGTEDPQAAHLEGGAGARPGGSQQVDGAEQILSPGRRGRGALPFG